MSLAWALAATIYLTFAPLLEGSTELAAVITGLFCNKHPNTTKTVASDEVEKPSNFDVAPMKTVAMAS